MKVVKSLADITLPKEGFVDIPRKGGDLRIPIRAIPANIHRKIMREAQAPAPPQKMRKDAQGKPTGEWYSDPNDPKYLELLDQSSDKMMAAVVLAGVALDIEGETEDAKFEALGERLTMGDLTIVVEGINRLGNITPEEEEENTEAVKNS